MQSNAKGQLNSELIYEVIVSPKMPTKIFPDFCPTKQTRIVVKKTTYIPPKKKVLQSLFVWKGRNLEKIWLAFWKKR